MKSWEVKDVVDFITALDLAEYAPLFAEKKITGSEFQDMTTDVLYFIHDLLYLFITWEDLCLGFDWSWSEQARSLQAHLDQQGEIWQLGTPHFLSLSISLYCYLFV